MKDRSIRIIQTSQGSREQSKVTFFHPDLDGTENQHINVYDDIDYQEVIGFSCAITEASADSGQAE